MPFPTNTILPPVVFAACFWMFSVTCSASLHAAEPSADDSSENFSGFDPQHQNSDRRFFSRDKTRPAPVRNWSRTTQRSGSLRATDTSTEPKIRFASASGAEEEVSSSAGTNEHPADHQTPSENDHAAPTPSRSVKEQLLNALRAQREASKGNSALPTKPGALTILNSPRTKSKSAVESAPPSDSEPNEHASAHVAPPAVNDHFDTAKSAVPAPAVTSPDKSRIGLNRTLEADIQSDDHFVRERAEKYLRLQTQLLKLRASQAAEAELPASRGDSHHTPGPANDHHSEQSRSDETPGLSPPIIPHAENQTESHQTESHQTESHQAESHQAESHAEKQKEHDSTLDAAVMKNVVVDGPIDRLGLANNLFAVGQFPLALEMYEQASAEGLAPHQRFWVEYQTANCIRRLGRPGEASQLYRKLASKPEAGWLSRQAQWWIETLEKIRALEAVLEKNSADGNRAMVEEMESQGTVAEPKPSHSTADHSDEKEPREDAHAHDK